MNDTDVTGPLPVIPAEEPSHGPVGWISEANRQAESVPADEPTGADPDLAFDFTDDPVPSPATTAVPLAELSAVPPTGPPGYEAGPEDTTAMPVVPALELEPDAPAEVQPTTPPAPPAPPPKSRHGQPAPLSRAWNAGIIAAIAVAAVVVGIIAFNYASPSPKAPANGAGPAFVLPSADPGITDGAVTSTPPGLDALPSASSSASASAGSGTASGVPADAPSVTVLNETTTHGLAAAEAARLRSAGWTVRRVTNINARLTQTTVYYDASQEAAAKALVASVPTIKVALPRPSYVLSTGGLIVVVAADAA